MWFNSEYMRGYFKKSIFGPKPLSQKIKKFAGKAYDKIIGQEKRKQQRLKTLGKALAWGVSVGALTGIVRVVSKKMATA